MARIMSNQTTPEPHYGQLFVVPVTRGDGSEGTEFVIVYAITSLEASDTVKKELGLTDEEVGCADDAIDALDSQYGGMAILSTF